MTPETFEGIARAIAPDAGNAVYARCPDQYVGTLTEVYGALDFPRREEMPPGPEMRVILVMESPHKAEFADGKHVGPANGPTGRNILKMLNQVLASVNSLVNENSQLVLMNAVQYQCSLREDTKAYRDDVFQTAWREGGGKEDFTQRLKDVFRFREGDLVINACTRGKTNPPLRDMVKEVIDEVVGAHWRTAHPYSWRLPVRTKAVWQPGIEAPHSSDCVS